MNKQGRIKKKRTLQFQITFFVGMVLVFISLILTMNSIYSANNYYGGFVFAEETVLQEEIDPDLVENDVITFADQLKLFSIQGIGVMLVAIVAALVITYWVTGRMLAPLYQLTDSIQKIDELNLDQRVECTGKTEEVLQLTRSFNSMMERLQESFFVQKNFAANAAHELKTPLTIMKTSLQVLNMDEEPDMEDYREFAQYTGEGLDRLIQTVDSLLFLANEQGDIMGEDILLKDLMEQIALHLEQRAMEKEVSVYVEGEEIVIEGSHTLFYRGFYNLIENAIKYNKQGGDVTIRIFQDKGSILVEIEDTGIGMTQENIKYMFHPFYRADKSRSQQIPGTGLGMSVVKMIFDQYQADIQVESKEKEGTKVTISMKAK